jgi:hypothetical protein
MYQVMWVSGLGRTSHGLQLILGGILNAMPRSLGAKLSTFLSMLSVSACLCPHF